MKVSFCIVLLLAAVAANSEVISNRPSQESSTPRTINFGGVLHDENGKPLMGARSVTFELYGTEAGGEILWSETQEIKFEDDGSYQVLLGASSSGGLPADLSSGDGSRWLGIQPAGLPETRVLLVDGHLDKKRLITSNPSPLSVHTVPFRSVLRDDQGKPMTVTSKIDFRLFKQARGGAPVWLETQTVEPALDGSYTVWLGAKSPKGLPEDLLPDGESRWLGIQPTGQAETRVSIRSTENWDTTSAEGDSSDGPAKNSSCILFKGNIAEDETPIEGSLSINFGLYDSETGGGLLWSEIQVVKLVQNGSYQVLLGAKSANGLPEVLFRRGEPRWLGIQVAGRTETRIAMESGAGWSNCLGSVGPLENSKLSDSISSQ